jgi:putative peptidyl-prolyl cis-trans isomerase
MKRFTEHRPLGSSLFLALILLFASACSSADEKQTQIKKFDKSTVEGERINSVRLLVGTRPITDIDYEDGSALVKLFRQGRATPKEVENFLIEKSIVDQVAEEESIVVSDERIDNEIKRRMEMAKETDEEAFKARIERETQVSFRLWKESLRYQMVRQQIVQIKVTIPQPDEKEVEKFYKQNAHRVGVELLFREIVFPVAPTIAAEREIDKRARQVHSQVSANPASFGDVARSLPENVSAFKAGGGIRLWIPIDDLAREDRVLAGMLYNLPQGAVSPVFRDSTNRYRIVLLEGKRPVSLEKIREMIRMQLFYDKADESFERWIEERKRNLVIRKPGEPQGK